MSSNLTPIKNLEQHIFSLPPHHFSWNNWELLVQLSDPEKTAPDLVNASEKCVKNVLEAARMHGVIEIVGRKLTPWFTNKGLESEIALLTQERQQLIAKTMLLDHHGNALSDMFSQYGIHSEIVKGPTFSNLLYKNREDRIYSDIDFLVKIDDVDRANRVIKDYGFVIGDKQLAAAERTLEYQWVLKTATLDILIEIQADLIHSPSLRRHVGYGYWEHTVADRFNVSPLVKLLLTAIMHTACSNKFGVLKVLVDVLQACRRLTPLDDIGLKLVVRQLQIELEVVTTVNLVANLFDDANAYRIAALFENVFHAKLSSRLITSDVIYASRYKRVPLRSGLHRLLFRIMQKSLWVRSLRA